MDSLYITMPKGFMASGVCADLKGEGKLDFALVYSKTPATVSGVYTSNLVKGHSLQRSIKLIDNGEKKHAIAINAKNANACVGPEGEKDAEKIALAIAKELNISSSEVLTASTGVIGIRLPVEKMISHVPELVSSLSEDEASAHNAELAMMTTDTVPKEVAAKITLQNGKEVTIAAMAKGSGMIHPNLATMICVFTTDAKIEKAVLDKMLKNAVSHTFNRVSVDGDTSVCDSVMVFANGESGVEITEGSEDHDIFYSTLEQLSTDLARMIACDGEGATKLLEVKVKGAATENDAKLVVTAIARSPLCKTAIFGEDANFGRFITAAGYSGASFDPDKLDMYVGDLKVCENGDATITDEEAAAKILSQHDIEVTVDLNAGTYEDRMFTCDFSYDYVKINGSYRS
ncbi:MAG: bifunctional glutamate N-acetyltransferase/amino-acid acetyltransferase ArgJ [Clostridiales bacterium]|nr:bifunctional glutamate N-acetyltransferase/amino-acid acetyltransferase ArgJ [Clostridiales bacterium]